MRPSPWHLTCATQTLAMGGVIAYPTEAVWGLGCDPWSQLAVDRLLKLKQKLLKKIYSRSTRTVTSRCKGRKTIIVGTRTVTTHYNSLVKTTCR